METRDAEVDIIRLLKESSFQGNGPGGYVSGQKISQGLGISRSAVWKHVENLRRQGYSIEAATHKGYRLARTDLPFNGIEVASRLCTGFIGRPLYFYPSIDSTNSRARELAGAGATEGTAVIADSQSAGRGRLGRSWVSPAGSNLYTSIVLRPPLPPSEAQTLTLMAAVAVAETVAEWLGYDPILKWPNDILIGSRKTAGILTEMSSETDRINHVILGIGVNLNSRSSTLPEPLNRDATSIMEMSGNEVERHHFTAALYSKLEKWYKCYLDDGFDGVRRAWQGYFGYKGRQVTVSGHPAVEGTCMGIDERGALVVRTKAGKTERVVAGVMTVQ